MRPLLKLEGPLVDAMFQAYRRAGSVHCRCSDYRESKGLFFLALDATRRSFPAAEKQPHHSQR